MIKNILYCSVFILMKGATKKRAFEVGYEIVDAVTKINPQPMKLKFEKVSYFVKIRSFLLHFSHLAVK